MTTEVDPAIRNACASVLRGRRTVHDFKPEPVAQALLLDALDAARWAPNHHRTEPWRVYSLGPKAQDAVAQLNATAVRESRGERAAEIKLKRWRSMPHWLVVTSLRSSDRLRELEDYAACCCAMQNLMLSFWSAGVGTKWTTGAVVRDPAFSKIVGFDAELEQVVGLFWYGWPAQVIEQHRAPVAEFLVNVD